MPFLTIDSAIRAAFLACGLLTVAATAKADCDTGFSESSVVTVGPRGETAEVVYFVCTPGGFVGDPDFGWSMAVLTSTDGREVRADKDDAKALRNAGVVR